MNELKFTYWLGAGASVGALPTVADFSDELKALAGDLEILSNNRIDSLANTIHGIAEEFQSLADAIPKYQTPDTLAKIFFLKGNMADYKRIKDVLTIFFLIKEFGIDDGSKPDNYKLDNRYINFLAGILKTNRIFPENLKILSWNYDVQFQLAADLIVPDNSLTTNNRREQPLFEYYPSAAINQKIEDYSLIHLNGCSKISNLDYLEVSSYFHGAKNITIENIIDIWDKLGEEKMNTLIKFAWEGDKSYQLIENHILETDILVVIGYSFPFFNREIDKQIFDLFNKGRLGKIYFQDPSLDGSFLPSQFNFQSVENFKERIELLGGPKSIVIEHISNCNQFFIPPEF